MEKIEFTRVYDQYVPGDIAILEPTLMRRLVRDGQAKWFKPVQTPVQTPEPKKEKPKKRSEPKKGKTKKAAKG